MSSFLPCLFLQQELEQMFNGSYIELNITCPTFDSTTHVGFTDAQYGVPLVTALGTFFHSSLGFRLILLNKAWSNADDASVSISREMMGSGFPSFAGASVRVKQWWDPV